MRVSILTAACAVAIVLAGSSALAATAERSSAGALQDGRPVETIKLSNSNGVSARILSYGATLQSLVAPDRDGKLADVTLGYDDLRSYETHPNYFGVTVGRYANRIAAGRFTLDGQTYQLPLNNGPNSLHGGNAGFDKKLWRITAVASSPKAASVTMTLTSPDGDMGYPGKLEVTVTYSLDEANALTIVFEARSSKPSIVNMTNHALFNLAGEGSLTGILEHRLTIPAARFTPVDATLIPTGELRPVAGTPFDFRNPRTVGDALRDGRDDQIRIGRGYDHNWALDKGITEKPELAARLEDPRSGRILEVLSTEPGLQMYTGNFLDGTLIGKGGHVYRMGDGMVLEPQKFPDAPNHPNFASARVDPATPYRHTMVLRLSVNRGR